MFEPTKVRFYEVMGKINKSERFQEKRAYFLTNALWNTQIKFGTERLEFAISDMLGISEGTVTLENYIEPGKGLVKSLNIVEIQNNGKISGRVDFIPLSKLIKSAKKMKKVLA